MKILVVQDRLRSGGTERQSVFLSNAFAAAAHPTTLLTFRPGGRLAATVSAGVRHQALQGFDLGLDWFAPGLRAATRRAAPDVILCMGRMANCYGAALHRQNPRAVVIATMRTGKPLPALFRRSLHAVRAVVANSQEARQTLVDRYGVTADRIHVIYNSLVFAPEPAGGAGAAARAGLRARHGATAETVVLLCVAMFRPEKNQRALIETVSALPRSVDYQLWLAGDGPARPGCEALVDRLGLRDRVKFVGFNADPAPLYAAADIGVHASWSDALSNFVIEAQAHGLPVVVYDSQGMRECCLPGRTGWVVPRDDHASFRARLAALVDEPDPERRARGAEARAFARARFDPAAQVSAYLQLFQSLR